MTIDLLPGHGVRLPAPLPELRFGATEAAVRTLLAPHGELLPDGLRPTFVCGSRWALGFELPGVAVTLSSGDGDDLRSVVVGRNPNDDRPVCPVGYHGIDLFGWPAHELVEALRAEGLPVPDPSDGGSLWYDTLHLSRHVRHRPPLAPGRKPRHQPPFHFDHASLHRTAPRGHRVATYPTGTATGPYDAAFLPRLELSPRRAGQPITAPVPKLGGRPCWLAEPAWPLSPTTGEPLVFIGQFPVPGEESRLAYLFLAADDTLMGGRDPEAGDGLLLIQPGGRIPPFAVIGPPGTRGRTLWRREPDGERTPVEFHLDLVPLSADLNRSMDGRAAFQRYWRGEGPEVPFPDGPHVHDHLGGIPSFPSGRAEVGPDWRYLFSLSDACEEDDPFFLDFDYGDGFGFLSPDGLEGRFFWDVGV